MSQDGTSPGVTGGSITVEPLTGNKIGSDPVSVVLCDKMLTDFVAATVASVVTANITTEFSESDVTDVDIR